MELVDRYAPLVYTASAPYRLSNAEIEDVGQHVWLRLVEVLGKLRDPAALPAWLATTTARECLRVLKATGKPEPDFDEMLRLDRERAHDEPFRLGLGTASPPLEAADPELPIRTTS